MMQINISKKLRTDNGEGILKCKFTRKAEGIIGVFGATGSGKTTLLRMLTGLTTPDEGIIRFGQTIWFDDSSGINLPPEKRSISYVSQDLSLFPHLTVFQNIAFSGADKDAVFTIMNRLGLTVFEKKFPGALSGGQKQRVAFARAYLRTAGLLLLDEALSAQDSEYTGIFREMIIEKASDTCIIMVSHNLVDHFSLTETILLADKLRIIEIGSPSTAFKCNPENELRLIGEVLAVNRKTSFVIIEGRIVEIEINSSDPDLAAGDKVFINAEHLRMKSIHSPMTNKTAKKRRLPRVTESKILFGGVCEPKTISA